MKEPLAHLEDIKPDSLITLYTVEQGVQVYAKEIRVKNKNRLGDPIRFSMAIKPEGTKSDITHFYIFDCPIYSRTLGVSELNIILESDQEILIKSSSGNVEVSLEGYILSREDAPTTLDESVTVYTVQDGTYLDTGELRITNNGQENAVVFYLVIEKDNIPVEHRSIIEPSQTITVDLGLKLDSGTKVLIRTSSFNIVARVEGTEVPVE